MEDIENIKHPSLAYIYIWVFPKIMVPPNHPLNNRVYHDFHHPFWGPTPIFGSTPIYVFICPVFWVKLEVRNIHHFPGWEPSKKIWMGTI